MFTFEIAGEVGQVRLIPPFAAYWVGFIRFDMKADRSGGTFFFASRETAEALRRRLQQKLPALEVGRVVNTTPPEFLLVSIPTPRVEDLPGWDDTVDEDPPDEDDDLIGLPGAGSGSPADSALG